jgi:hypothetical protein
MADIRGTIGATALSRAGGAVQMPESLLVSADKALNIAEPKGGTVSQGHDDGRAK